VVYWSEFLATDPEVRVRFPERFWEVVGLERGPLSLVSTTEELFERKSSGSGLEIREYGRRDSSRWSCGTLYPQKLAITLPINGGRSVSIVRSRTQTMEFFCFFFVLFWIITRRNAVGSWPLPVSFPGRTRVISERRATCVCVLWNLESTWRTLPPPPHLCAFQKITELQSILLSNIATLCLALTLSSSSLLLTGPTFSQQIYCFSFFIH
jgi:hypothetical protein